MWSNERVIGGTCSYWRYNGERIGRCQRNQGQRPYSHFQSSGSTHGTMSYKKSSCISKGSGCGTPKRTSAFHSLALIILLTAEQTSIFLRRVHRSTVPGFWNILQLFCCKASRSQLFCLRVSFCRTSLSVSGQQQPIRAHEKQYK